MIGAGASGLMAANLLAEKGHETTLFESHKIPGGCASWFRRPTAAGPCSFDVGATVVPCFKPGSWWFNKLSSWNLVDELGFKPSESVFFDINNKRFEIACSNEDEFFDSLSKAFESDASWIQSKLKPEYSRIIKLQNFVETLPQWPLENLKQCALNLTKLNRLPKNYHEIKLLLTPYKKWQGDARLSKEFVEWMNMTALISVQSHLTNTYALYGLLAIFFHSLGSGTFEGGMRRYFEVLLKKFRLFENAEYKPSCKIEQVTKDANKKYQLSASSGEVFAGYDKVFFSCPRMQSESLIGKTTQTTVPNDLWSAMSMYLVVKDDDSWSENAFNWHIKNSELNEEIFASFSRKEDLSRAPSGYRTVTVSCHEPLDKTWFNISQDDYKNRKEQRAQNLLKTLTQSLRELNIVHKESSSPKTWHRYTQRPLGTVGGLPLSMPWTVYKTPKRFLSSDQNLVQIGDTSFPGQSLYSCAMSAAMAIEASTF